MAHTFSRLGKIALLIAAASYPFLAHSVIAADGRTTLLGVALAVAPIALFGLWLMTLAGKRGIGAAVLLLALAVIATVSVAGVGQGLVLACGLPHAIAYLSLLWIFGRTLISGREPIVTRFARIVHGQLPAEIDSYTRRVTWAWCIFFASQVVLSLLLYAFAPRTAWSLFVNVLSGPSVALMFVCEYLWRLYRYRNFQHSSLMQAVRAFTRRNAVATSPHSQS